MTMLLWNKLIEPQLVIFSCFAVFYVYVLLVLLTSKQKLVKGSYFIIFIYTGIVDLILFLGDQYFRASDRLGTGPELNFILIICSQITGINFSLHVFGNFLQVLCQYMAVCWTQKYEKHWSYYKTLLYLLLLTIGTNAAYFGGWWMKNEYILRPDGSYSAQTVEDDSTVYIFASIQVVLYVFVSIFLITRTLISLEKLGASKQLKRHYRSLAIITLLDCFLFCIDLIYEIDVLFSLFDIHFYPKWLVYAMNNYFDIFYSTIYVSNPVILVLCSRIARSELTRPFRRKFSPPLEITKTDAPKRRATIHSITIVSGN